MPRRPEFTERYTDALQTLQQASGRVARVTNDQGHYSLRVDFEFGRFLTATNTDSFTGLCDVDADDPWRVRIFDARHGDCVPEVIADHSATWLIDAYDAALVNLPPAAEV